jgi:hypothetical protein
MRCVSNKRLKSLERLKKRTYFRNIDTYLFIGIVPDWILNQQGQQQVSHILSIKDSDSKITHQIFELKPLSFDLHVLRASLNSLAQSLGSAIPWY